MMMVCALSVACACCQAQQVMDNAAVLKMKDAGLGDSVIVATVNASPGKYDMSMDNMIALKNAGLSDAVIGAMISRNANPNGPAVAGAAPGAPALPDGVDEVGVYYKDAKTNKWVEFQPEIVNYKSGGAMKSAFSYGIVKQDKNGHVPGKSAALGLTHPVEILIYAPEGTAPNEYQLLKLRVNSDNREFRSETGGVFHKSGGAERDRQDFDPKKIGPRLYTATLGPEIKAGEYGILPPGSVSSSNVASAGKIDSFRITE